MIRRRFSIFRCSFLLALAGLFLYSASVQEIHYLFTEHQVERTEHCDNHLHANANKTECSFCKIDLSSYVQSFAQYESAAQILSANLNIWNLRDGVINNQHPSISLRGPPAVV